MPRKFQLEVAVSSCGNGGLCLQMGPYTFVSDKLTGGAILICRTPSAPAADRLHIDRYGGYGGFYIAGNCITQNCDNATHQPWHPQFYSKLLDFAVKLCIFWAARPLKVQISAGLRIKAR